MHQTDGLAITGDRVGKILEREPVTLGCGAVVTCNTLPDVFSLILAPCETATISYVLSSGENNTNVASGSPQVETYREVGTELARVVAQLEPRHQEPLQPNLPLPPLFSETNVLSMQTDPRLVSCVVIGLAVNCGPVLRTILSARQRTMLRETDCCGTRLGT
jgi:hypothetical protein